MRATEAFERWYAEAHPRLLASLVLVARDRGVAEDVAAEACARCLDRWERRGAPDDPSAWTYRVAINDLRRRWRRSARHDELVARLVPPAPLEVDDPAIELWRAVAALPERARLAVALRYLAGLTEPQVAEVMGIAVGTVGATLTKARARLADELRAVGLAGVDGGDGRG
ncbi:MAG: sigma-70 family RNA polymerase sigma factor [Acidimicrobiales bacterium]|mgnify:CR=1 FL=1|nr:sigma-70 family RNA polymerase sigma factor [Acidimicrobiales bacterium]HRW39075.1 sigma-70 family RNA polymerase sigma factor [Aquihabitans sp.]